MEEGNKYGTISHYMKDTGWMIRPKEEADLSMGMAMCMKESGKTTKLTGKEFIPKAMGPVIQVNGFRTSSMDLELKNGQMGHHTRGK